MDYPAYTDIHVSIADGVGRFTLARPEKLNAFRSQTVDEILDLAGRLEADDDVRAVLCTHEGRGFSAGVDLTSAAHPAVPESRTAGAHALGITRIGAALSAIEKPTIAAVDGVAAGAGMAFACAFDLRYVGPRTRFITAFARQGLGPNSGLSYSLPRLVGWGRAFDLIYSSREVGGEEAVAIGLATEFSPDPEARAVEVARSLAQGPTIAYMVAKRALRRSAGGNLHDQMEYEWANERFARESEDRAEARQAFTEKRTPRFKGR